MKIIVTGASGFIGSTTADRLSKSGHEVVGIDKGAKHSLLQMLDESPPEWAQPPIEFDAMVHLGACTDTLETNRDFMLASNTEYTKLLWAACARRKKIFIYASSAATYGDGSQGFDDDTSKLGLLKPLNVYGESKHLFDLWAVEQAKQQKAPPRWAGLKFFNVYGRNEASKGRMASMVYRIYHQAQEGKVRLFKSGEQTRDWIFVEDVVDIIEHMLEHPCHSIYNVGTGTPSSFNDIANYAFALLGKKPDIEYIDMPRDMTSAYQSFSKANMAKVLSSYKKEFNCLHDGMLKMHYYSMPDGDDEGWAAQGF